ncbi:MAG TPA: L-serine ammonia-lyase, iron-sulfur-dependent, subunit alpha [Candidatus Ornithospirochaeta avicola]|uniref:UPF0597 protein IAB12_00035 n=1 Tax=Candidatus Ornithospirochaeta avicola TaxID=2840896 RepID=A0A9D1PRB7_9SPIO|nr:L-serine ammonia-lyase, iron-sulfur-dependent, subunit alpha [Candidatus Ornithospirochaeta avicola]
MFDRTVIDNILKSEIATALGCTEPACAALCGAKARDLLEQRPLRADVYVSRDMMKNAMGVSIPNSDKKGISAAVALGLATGGASRSLDVLSSVSEEERATSSEIEISLHLDETAPSLYISVKAYGENSSSVCTIENEHDRFSYLEKDGIKLDVSGHIINDCASGSSSAELDALTVSDILDYASSLSPQIKELLRSAVSTNLDIAYAGLEKEWGLSVGRTMFPLVGKVQSMDDAMRKAASLASSASDARMAGSCRPVMINSGSGNQGITVTVPVKVVADYLKKSEEEMLSAVAVSELTALVLTSRKARLSALCGAFTASIGTAVAWTYLSGGREKEIDMTVNNMIGNLSGIICDGAKRTCALKIYTCLIAASISVHLALNGVCASVESGIVGKDSLESISYLSKLSHEGMEETDRTILKIMLEKENRN